MENFKEQTIKGLLKMVEDLHPKDMVHLKYFSDGSGAIVIENLGETLHDLVHKPNVVFEIQFNDNPIEALGEYIRNFKKEES